MLGRGAGWQPAPGLETRRSLGGLGGAWQGCGLATRTGLRNSSQLGGGLGGAWQAGLETRRSLGGLGGGRGAGWQPAPGLETRRSLGGLGGAWQGCGLATRTGLRNSSQLGGAWGCLAGVRAGNPHRA